MHTKPFTQKFGYVHRMESLKFTDPRLILSRLCKLARADLVRASNILW
jgi:hypothetical protein